jgi:hypothetical protein
MERIRAQIAIRVLHRRPKGFAVAPKLLDHALSFLEQPLFKVTKLLFDIGLAFFTPVVVGDVMVPLP